MKTYFTFDRTTDIFKGKLNPLSVILVVEGKDVASCRNKVQNSFIGDKYFSYFPYKELSEETKRRTGFVEYSLDSLKKAIS